MILTNMGHDLIRFSQREPLGAINVGTHRSLVARMGRISKCGWAIYLLLFTWKRHIKY